MNLISVIIINYNTPEMTLKAIRSFMEHSFGFDYEIILIDNNSAKKIKNDDLKSWPIKYIENKENLGFAQAVNQGIKNSNGSYVLLLNSDALIKENSAGILLDYISNDLTAGIIGPKLSYADGRNQTSSGKFPDFRKEFFRLTMLHRLLPFSAYNKNFSAIKEVDWVSGAFMLIKREVIKQIGGFDENYFFSAEDMDFCLAAKKAGWKTIYYPLTEVIHYYGFSSGGRKSIKGIKMERDGINYFFKKNYPRRIIRRFAIYELHNLKMFVLSLLGYK